MSVTHRTTPATREAALRDAKRRLRELSDTPRSELGATPCLAGPHRHPWGWTLGALALGVAVPVVARTAAGRTIARAAGRAALTAAQAAIVPAISGSTSPREPGDARSIDAGR